MTGNDIPTLTHKNKKAWVRLLSCKPFFLQVGMARYYVNKSGMAVQEQPDGAFAGVPTPASRLLDPEKRPRR